jgi:hypothetical protein
MPTNSSIEISKLSLDLKNYRTIPQKTEIDAIKAMITISPDRFYAVMLSIVQDGYTPTENIIVLSDEVNYIVKEGNRRIACLKLIHGIYKINEFGIPKAIIDQVLELTSDWKKENLKVPCTIFDLKESDKADKVVDLIHGKNEKASREKWTSVATARHSRDAKGMPEPALDLLEKYLSNSNNITHNLKEIWSGDYPLTVLHEAIRHIHSRLGFTLISDLVKNYPAIKQVKGIDELIKDIGSNIVKFKTIRDTHHDFASKYGIESIEIQEPKNAENLNSSNLLPSTTISNPENQVSPNETHNQPLTNSSAPVQTNILPSNSNQSNSTNSLSQVSLPQSASTSSQINTSPLASSTKDPKYVATLLDQFHPRGDRAKVVALRDEIKSLKIKDNPIAFCFLLRSMFEISAKKYCEENSIPTQVIKVGKPTKDKTLVDLLTEIYNKLTADGHDKPMTKRLHGAYTTISKPEGILSVTSMNNLVHNPLFSVSPHDICILFGNIYPLLEDMN